MNAVSGSTIDFIVGQRLMGSFSMASLRQVLANLRGKAKTREIIVPKSRKKGSL